MSALVVEPTGGDRTFLVTALTSAGLLVTAAESFPGARMSLVSRPPAVLITEIRLGPHNGLHLAHIGRWIRQDMVLIVTSPYADAVLTREAEALGAVFVQKPLMEDDLFGALHHALPPERQADRQVRDPAAARR